MNKILFTQPEIDVGHKLPELEKYVGYLWFGKTKGKAKLLMK